MMKYTREEIIDGTLEYINNNETLYNHAQRLIKIGIERKKKDNSIDVIARCVGMFFRFYKNSYFGDIPVRLYAIKKYFIAEVDEVIKAM